MKPEEKYRGISRYRKIMYTLLLVIVGSNDDPRYSPKKVTGEK